MNHRHFNRVRPLCTWLLLCALLLRATIPQGYMPGSIAKGTPLVVCAGGIYKTVLVDAHGNLQADHQPQHEQHPCPFAAAPLLSSPPSIAWQPDFYPELPKSEQLLPGVLPLASPHIHLPRGPPKLS
jgi:hypothetical protein